VWEDAFTAKNVGGHFVSKIERERQTQNLEVIKKQFFKTFKQVILQSKFIKTFLLKTLFGTENSF
jgi:hypothetical protein